MGDRVKRVPVVMQMEALECGAASLSMVLAYYKKWVPLERMRTDCGVSRDGSSARNILAAAQGYGFLAKGYRMDVEELKKVDLPCIIHWNFNHFVVLDGFKRNSAVINDPARGRVEIPMEEFDAAYTGVCLTFTPAEDFIPGGHKKSVLKFASDRLRGTLAPVLFVILTGIITSCVGIVYPGFGRIFLDRILTRENSGWLYPLLGAMLLVLLVHLTVSVIHALYMLKIEGKLAIIANTTFIWHVLRLPMEFYSQRLSGDIADRQQSNESIASTLMNELAPVVLDFALLVIYFAVMVKYSLMLTAIGLGAALFNVMIAHFISRKRLRITRVQFRDQGKLAAATVGGIDMIETIKASGAENGYFERWAGYQAAVNTSTVRFTKLNQYLGAVPGFLISIANGSVLLVGIWQIMEGSFTAGMLLAFQGYLSAFMTPFQSIVAVGQNVQEMRSSMERIEDVMDYPVDVLRDGKEDAPVRESQPEKYRKLPGDLEMKHVTFGYSRMEKPLIEDFDLTLKKGRSVALVGATGCGKSTLAKLVTGLYKPWSGEISLGGEPAERIPREIFTGSVAVVDQDIILFEDTIAGNLRMWDPSIEDSDLIRAAKDAVIHEDIMEREGGYGYRILEGGRDFSGGQRQRLEIARALAQNPTLLIMDEATSALDAVTEYKVMEAVRKRGITCILIAHRLSAIRDCDEIIVLDHGRVAERGTHEELYELGGEYRRLVTTE